MRLLFQKNSKTGNPAVIYFSFVKKAYLRGVFFLESPPPPADVSPPSGELKSLPKNISRGNGFQCERLFCFNGPEIRRSCQSFVILLVHLLMVVWLCVHGYQNGLMPCFEPLILRLCTTSRLCTTLIFTGFSSLTFDDPLLT